MHENDFEKWITSRKFSWGGGGRQFEIQVESSVYFGIEIKFQSNLYFGNSRQNMRIKIVYRSKSGL